MAADKLVQTQPDKTIVAAMGFLTVGEDSRKTKHIINDRIDVVTKNFLGLTVTCARATITIRSHPHRDYYSLHGVFASCVEPAQEPIIGKVNQNSTNYIDYYNQTRR